MLLNGTVAENVNDGYRQANREKDSRITLQQEEKDSLVKERGDSKSVSEIGKKKAHSFAQHKLCSNDKPQFNTGVYTRKVPIL